MAIYLGGNKVSRLPSYKKAFYGLSPIWSAKIKITFALDGGTAPSGFTASQVIEPGEITLPGKPTKDMFNFLGWDDGQGNVYPAGVKVNISQDTNFTASWKAVVVTTETEYKYESITPGSPSRRESSDYYKYQEVTVGRSYGQRRLEYRKYFYDGVYHHTEYIGSTVTRYANSGTIMVGTKIEQNVKCEGPVENAWHTYRFTPEKYIPEWNGKRGKLLTSIGRDLGLAYYGNGFSFQPGSNDSCYTNSTYIFKLLV